MKKQPQLTGNRQKQFVKLYEQLSPRHSRWSIWSDFVLMSAATISNAFDKEHAAEREKIYMNIIGKYTGEELDVLAKMFGTAAMALEENPQQDFLGDMYMALGMRDEGRAQFFTPYHISHLMSRLECAESIQNMIANRGWVSVLEPACGSGVMMIAFANVCREQKLNYHDSVLFVGQDIDLVVGCMSYIQLSLIGCPGYVVIGNSLERPVSGLCCGLVPNPDQEVWYTPTYFGDIWDKRRQLYTLEVVMELFKSEPKASRAEERELPPISPDSPEVIAWKETEAGQLAFL